MATKRKYRSSDEDDNSLHHIHVSNKKHTLDSDEDDSDDYEKADLGESDVEGEEDGISKIENEVKVTPFNMREELEEGHFDKEGHYHWNKSDEINDNWLDNIDWIKIENQKKKSSNENERDATDVNSMDVYNESKMYAQLLSYMKEGETVSGSLRRLGKNRTKISSVERLKLKKKGIVDENGEKIARLTEAANQILTKTGNMDIYQATYDSIKEKIDCTPTTSRECGVLAVSDFDMYSDDFNEKEKLHKEKCVKKKQSFESNSKELLWEFKWEEKDTAVQGPFNTQQMLKWSKDGYFKKGVYVRKLGEQNNFHTSNRIDFELYV